MRTPRHTNAKRRTPRLLLGLGLTCGLVGGAAQAEEPCVPLPPLRLQCPPPCVPQCPPSGMQPLPVPPQTTPGQPTPPRREGEPAPMPTPTPTPAQESPFPSQPMPYSQAPMQGTAAAESYAPNILGDFFGGGTSGTTRSVIPCYVQRNEPAFVSNIFQPLVQGAGMNFILRRFQPGPNPNQPPFETFFRPVSGAMVPNNPQAVVGLDPSQPNAFFPADPNYRIIRGSATNFHREFFGEGSVTLADLSYIEQCGFTELSIPSPGAGANVGRGKIAENNSPFPVDRVFFRYSHFDSVAFLNGQDVYRYTPGFEKTFMDGECSVEVRFPFAGTVDPTMAADQGYLDRSTEFGNIMLVFKGLIYNGPTFRASCGMGVGIPTANDVSVTTVWGEELVHIENRVWHLMPFVAGLYMPDDRLFMQAFLQLDVGAGGHPVNINPDLAGLRGAGYLNDATLMTLDLNAGYWLMRDTRADFLTGLAPFVELHYNFALEDVDEVNVGGFRIGDLNGRFDILNVTLGAHFELGGESILSIGLITPITGNNNREFDYEVGILFNHRFGPVSWPN